MTGTTLQSTVLDRTPVVSAAANAQKTTVKSQGFGDVLENARQASRQVSENKPVQADKIGADGKNVSTEPKNVETDAEASVKKNAMEADDKSAETEETAQAVEKDAETENTSDENVAVEEKAVDVEDAQEQVAEAGEIPVIKLTVAKRPVDGKTIDEIADALEQIISQIKQLLGITDEELLVGMEKAGMTGLDLLNPDNMTKLVTAVSGNDSAISLVADEKLYAALQDISTLVETKVNELLDKTGLTDDEIEIVLQTLKEMESAQPQLAVPGQKQVLDAELIENGTEPLPEDTKNVQENAKPLPEGPIIIKEDNTKPARQYDTLPENQQENPVETIVSTKTQHTQRETRHDDGSESKNFGQGNAQQSFRGAMGEVNGAVAAESVARFVSESTENILRQLADMVKIVKNEGLTEMELQLHPASLGTVNVSLTTKGGAVTAHFTTQNEAVKAAIESQVAQLQTKLEEQGVKVEAVEVSVGSHEMERNLDKDGSEQQRSEQESTQRIQGARRRSINLRSLEEGAEADEELMGDDAARIAMEIMTANGNSMDLLA